MTGAAPTFQAEAWVRSVLSVMRTEDGVPPMAMAPRLLVRLSRLMALEPALSVVVPVVMQRPKHVNPD